MSRIIYCNGRYVPYGEAMIHAEDRGFQFGDAIYEVCEVMDGRLVDETRHMDRLERSLNELKMPQPMSRQAWSRVLRETIRRNRLDYGSVYLQVSCRPARFPVPRQRHAEFRCRHRPQWRSRRQRRACRQGYRRQNGAGQPMGALRYQNRHAAAGQPRQGSRQGRGGQGGLVR
jgi:branched-subunit amino acid aminotransferase/4-amino-4-deoxychorismate lyase